MVPNGQIVYENVHGFENFSEKFFPAQKKPPDKPAAAGLRIPFLAET
jgi:hypothetical protein